MDPITLGLLGFLGYKAITSRNKSVAAGIAPVPESPPQPPVVQSKPVGIPLPGFENVPGFNDAINPTVVKAGSTLATIAVAAGASAPFAAAAGGLMVAGYAAGKMITGNELGGVIGAFSPITGNLANVGFVVGGEIDKGLGGDGDNEGASFVAKLGTAAVLIGSAAGSIVALPFAAIAYGIASAIEDGQRYEWGKGGGADRECLAFVEINRMKFLAMLQKNFPEAKFEMLDLIAYKYARAYARECNLLSYKEWMARSKGVFVTWKYHALWGRDRGYFVGTVGGDSDNPHLVETITADWAIPSTSTDTVDVALSDAARKNANIKGYVDWMKEPYGFAQSHTSHCNWGKDRNKMFVGKCREPEGFLEYEGGIYDRNGRKVN